MGGKQANKASDTTASSCDFRKGGKISKGSTKMGAKGSGKISKGSTSKGAKGARGPSSSDKRGKPSSRVRLHRFDKSYEWSGVRPEAYKKPDGSWADVVRHTLIGERGESTDFHLRYFEVAPGGMTSLEKHGHEHVVVGIRGSGVCRVRRRDYVLGFMDVIYIPPGAPHQLRNRGSAPFGFFCIVDAERDGPVTMKD